MVRLGIVASLLLLAACAAPPERSNTGWPVTGVVDGDTLRVQIDTLPTPLAEVHVRLRGVDTPERGGHARCDGERDLAERAYDYTRGRILGAKTVEFRHLEWDKYGGRVLAEVLVDGRPLAGALIAEGLGQPYFGGQRPNWCFAPDGPAHRDRGKGI